MGLFARSWQFTKSSLKFLRQNLDLLWISLVSFGIFTGIMLIAILGFGLLSPLFGPMPEHSISFYIDCFITLLILSFLMLFANVWLTACITQRLKGEPGSLSDGFKLTMRRLPSILGWAIINSTVGTVLQTLERSHNLFANIIGGILNVSWALAAYFVIPIIIFQHIGPIKAIKLSSTIFKRSIKIRAGVGVVALLILLPMAALYFLISAIVNHQLAWPRPLEVSIIAALGVLLIAAIYINQLFQLTIRSAMYLFFIEKSTPAGFDSGLLETAMVSKSSKG